MTPPNRTSIKVGQQQDIEDVRRPENETADHPLRYAHPERLGGISRHGESSHQTSKVACLIVFQGGLLQSRAAWFVPLHQMSHEFELIGTFRRL